MDAKISNVAAIAYVYLKRKYLKTAYTKTPLFLMDGFIYYDHNSQCPPYCYCLIEKKSFFNSHFSSFFIPEAQKSNTAPPEAEVTVLTVEGGRADLPCDIAAKSKDDSVYLVLWYRKNSGTPIYR